LRFKYVVAMKSPVFWYIMLCSLADIYWSFRGMFHFHHQDLWLDQASSNPACLAYCSLWRSRLYIPLKHQQPFTRLYGIISQNDDTIIVKPYLDTCKQRHGITFAGIAVKQVQPTAVSSAAPIQSVQLSGHHRAERICHDAVLMDVTAPV
jgi:hypothetical protein